MTDFRLRHQILTLHYIIQCKAFSLQVLIQHTKNERDILCIDTGELAKILNISKERALSIKQQFYEYLSIPFEQIYTTKNYSAIIYKDEKYPSSLQRLSNPPAVLYCIGNDTLLNRRKVAIIGSRNATNYTKKALQYIIPPLVNEQFVIVSGFAKGADTYAYNTTLCYGGQTIAVLGSGFHHIYPRENRQLFEQIDENVCFVTEYPPYMEPKKWNFPMRNRIISGLSEGLIVTEAEMRSGTMITTDLALEQGKDVFVLPGPIDSKLSEGTNFLIYEGAIPIWNGYQVVNELK